jgi:hypothetical protein
MDPGILIGSKNHVTQPQRFSMTYSDIFSLTEMEIKNDIFFVSKVLQRKFLKNRGSANFYISILNFSLFMERIIEVDFVGIYCNIITNILL